MPATSASRNHWRQRTSRASGGWGRTRRSLATRAAQAAYALWAACLSGCGDGDHQQVRKAIAAQFPDGLQNCFRLSADEVGIHLPQQIGEQITFAQDELISPTRHMHVFYAAPAGRPVPELVSLLAERGVLERHTVDADDDVETTGLGPQQISAAGIYYHANWFKHVRHQLTVAIYTTDAADPHFAYDVHQWTRMGSWGSATFRARIYSGDPAPADSHYVVPTAQPFATSIVTSACTVAKVDHVDTVLRDQSLDGRPYVHAAVTLSQHAPDWMDTPAFRRASGGIDSHRLTDPVEGRFVFDPVGSQLYYNSGGVS